MNPDHMRALLKALEAGDYNAAPSILRSGTIFPINEPLTEHEADVLWTKCFGYPGYRDYPRPETTLDEIQEVVNAAHEYAILHSTER